MKVSTILISGFFIIILLISIVGFVSLKRINVVIKSFKEVTEDASPVLLSLIHLEHGFVKMREEIMNYAISGKEEEKADFQEALEHFREHKEEIIKRESHGGEEWQNLINLLEDAEKKIIKLSEEIFELKDSGALSGVFLRDVSKIIELGDTENILKIALEERTEYEQNELKEQQNVVLINESKARTDIIIFSVSGISISLVLIFLISYLILKPINKLTENVDEITKGKLDIQLEKSNIFEIEKLTSALSRILASLKLAILRTGAGKSELGLGEAIEAKEEAEKKYRSLYESSSDAIMILEPPEWRFSEGNSATLNMFGAKDEKDFTSRGPGDYSPKYQPYKQLSSVKAKKMIDKAMKEGSNLFDWTHKRLNGEEFPATVLLSRVTIKGKDVLQATVRDVSKENEANEKIQLDSKIMNNISEGVYLVGADDGIIKYTNPKFAKMFGYEPNEMIGKHASMVNAPTEKNPKQTAKEIMGVLKKTEEWHGEVQNIKKDGTKFWCYANVSVFNHKAYGKVLVAVHTDITEKKKIEEEIKAEKEFSQEVINTIPYGVDIVDEKLNVLYMNKTFLNLFGKKSIGKMCYNIYKDNKKQCENCPLKKPVKIGETKTLITSGIAGGKTFKITHTGFKLPNGKKAILEFFDEVEGTKEKETKPQEYEKALKKLFSKYNDMPSKKELEEVFLGKKK